VRNPIRFSETPADYRLPPPGLDEHGAVIRDWLAAPVGTDGAVGREGTA
jgi:crotonobetainyl-CoA:carnitine CoA-transferase CaiB-like acyl-CoA transferase